MPMTLSMRSPIDVSVIVATRNRAKELYAMLSSLERQPQAQISYEVIVVANGCSDDTSAVLAQLTTTKPLRAVYLDRAGKSAALNRGMEVARGNLLAFTDDDVIVSDAWLAELWRAYHEHSSAAGFCGPIKPMYPDSTPSWLRSHPFRVPAFAEFQPPFAKAQCCTLLPFGPNLSVRRCVSTGLRFRTDLGASDINGPISCEDTEFASRIKQHAGPIWYIPTAAVEHKIRLEQLTYSWLVERAFVLGQSLVAQTRPEVHYHNPVWHIPLQPSAWSRFDRSLLANFFIGQLWQLQRYEQAAPLVAHKIYDLLTRIVYRQTGILLSQSCKLAVAADDLGVLKLHLAGHVTADDSQMASSHESKAG
jgi:glycosyltransferase involved in cell wall biosynthesis